MSLMLALCLLAICTLTKQYPNCPCQSETSMSGDFPRLLKSNGQGCVCVCSAFSHARQKAWWVIDGGVVKKWGR